MDDTFTETTSGDVHDADGNKLGFVYLSKTGTGVGRFDFVVDRSGGAVVEIGTPVTADTAEGPVVGSVVDMRVVGWADSPHLAEQEGIGAPGVPDDRTEVLVAEVAVADAPAMRPTRAGWVRAATREELADATGAKIINWPVPCGAVALADGTWAPLAVSGENVVGPEGGHVLVGGLSGVASKTSFMGVLLRSAMHAANHEGKRMGALIFNVKGTDLIDIDKPPAKGYELQDVDRELWEALGVPAEPFPQITVWSPALPGGGGHRSPREDAVTLRWDLRDVWQYLRYLLPHLYDDEKTASFVADFADKKMYTANNPIDTFDKLEAWFDHHLAGEDEDGEKSWGWSGHHKMTMGKMRRMLMSLVPRCGGLLTRSSADSTSDVPDVGWLPGDVQVVDLAGLDPQVQGMVVARTVERLLRSAENNELGVDHLAIMVDELNQWAPTQGGEFAAVKSILQRVVTQGRYAGVSLFGAGQKLSRIDELVRDNASTRVLGRTADGELASGVYGKLPGGLSERIATLERGQAVVWHPTMRVPQLVRFPRPAWQTGRPIGDTRRRSNPIDTVGANSDIARRRLTSGLDPDTVNNIIAEADDADAAVQALRNKRTIDPHDVQLPSAPSAAKDPSNPFDLD